MYRNIWVDQRDQNFQRIVWRDDDNAPIREYKLRTVSYGLASSPFLATRALKQVAFDCENEFPKISKIIKNNIYIDDLLSSTDDLTDAIKTVSQIYKILAARGFILRKWRSNSPELLKEISSDVTDQLPIEFEPSIDSKVLGLHWDSATDMFFFKASLNIIPEFTKRKILSESSRVFDPLGLLSPCTVTLKVFYQKLWLYNLDWDTPIPKNLSLEWDQYQNNFSEINSIKIPRWIGAKGTTIELHGFCDASELAYAAALYCVQRTASGCAVSNLLVAKTKVSPVKQLSIPRLELNGALLLARLFQIVFKSLKDYNFQFFAWSDAQVVLSWLSAHPRKWKMYIANRTSAILDVIPREKWFHVPTKDNPADVASRGISPQQLSDCSSWWHGPPWLVQDPSTWPQSTISVSCDNSDVLAEEKTKQVHSYQAHSVNNILADLFMNYSSFSKITNILAYIKRFIKNCREAINHSKTLNFSSSTRTLMLNLTERSEARKVLFLYVQETHFASDIECIKKGKALPSKSILLSLNPFLDQDGVLRVGGRLENSSLNYDAKHPVILPSSHAISNLIIKQFHITYLHAGPTLLSNILRQSFWILGAKKLIRSFIHKCLVCIRYRANKSQQLMGDLPKHRIVPQRPFCSTGLDYAGPIVMKMHKGRGSKTYKGYISIFVCMSTKAIHCECVSDLSADSFIAALRRFSSRRGAPRNIFCDNGSNFVGARRKLDDIQTFLQSVSTNELILHYLSQSSIVWHFIPPSSPHFGGLWESAVRSVKFHLRRVVGNTLLTFEEMTTFLSQVEAVLNSRPLTTVCDSDSSSLDILTPSHFLTGDVITSIPDDCNSSSMSYTCRWELVQKLFHGFWKRWCKEYLNSLQKHTKWTSPEENFQLNDLVLIREDNMPPGTWPLGRIVEVHPGRDGYIRVASLKTIKGVFKRPIAKLIKLPSSQAPLERGGSMKKL